MEFKNDETKFKTLLFKIFEILKLDKTYLCWLKTKPF